MSAPGAPSFAQVNSDYQTYLGRPLSQAEYDQYWANKTDYNATNVSNSAEAIAYNQRNLPASGNAGPTPTTPTGGEVGSGTPWAPGASAPSSAPPGYHWDAGLAMFQPDAPAAPPTTGGPGGGGSGGPAAPPPVYTPPPVAPPQVGPPSGDNPGAPVFTPPSYTPPPAYVPPPAFSYADYAGADPFSYADFAAPDPNDLQNDPTYQYTLKTQQDAISKSAAAKGILNTGGTINDLLLNANDIAQQGYQNLYNRKQQDYATNRGNAFQNYTTNEQNRFQDYAANRAGAVQQYNTNYQTQYVDPYTTNYQTQYTDPYKYQYQSAQDAYNAAAHNFDQGQYYTQHNIDQNKQYDWAGTLFGYQQQQDQWANKFKLLGLI
jgi:hypothetical protein